MAGKFERIAVTAGCITTKVAAPEDIVHVEQNTDRIGIAVKAPRRGRARNKKHRFVLIDAIQDAAAAVIGPRHDVAASQAHMPALGTQILEIAPDTGGIFTVISRFSVTGRNVVMDAGFLPGAAAGRKIVETNQIQEPFPSFDRDGNPISVNNAFFTTCAASPCSGVFEKAMTDKCPAMMSCDATTQTCGGDLCTDGMTELAAYYPEFYSGTGDDPKVKRGGGTAWLTTKAPVNPGEIFNLDFYIWDTGDLRFDSSVILDNFQWSCEATTNATDFASPVEDIN